jgi:hypothetical protein
MNEHLNMTFLSLSLSLSSQYVNICIRFNSDSFSTEKSKNYKTKKKGYELPFSLAQQQQTKRKVTLEMRDHSNYV